MSSSVSQWCGFRLHRRFIFLLLFVSYVVVGISTYRLQPVLSSAMDVLGADEAQLGVLMSVASTVSLLTTMLAGLLVMRVGYCRSLSIAMALELIGLGVALKFLTYWGISASQLLLGLGNTLIMVTAPSAMQAMYSPDEYAMRIGIINSGQTAGQGIVFLLLPTLIIRDGFSSIWNAFLVPIGILLLIWGLLWSWGGDKRLFCNSNDMAKRGETEAVVKSPFPLKDGRFWILSAGVLFCMLSAGAALNYTALYLKSIKGFSETEAGNMMFGCTVMGVAAAMAGGPLGRKLGPRRVYVWIALLQAALRSLIVFLNGWLPLAAVTALTGIPAAMVVICNTAVPRLCRNSRYIPVAVSMIATATTGGLALSSLVFGRLITVIGFDASFLVFVPLSLVALLAAMAIPKD